MSLLDETHPLENARRFFAEMMCHDQDMIEYFQVINGLFLTPEMPDREGSYIPCQGTWAPGKEDSINRTVLYAAYQQWCHSSNAASTMLPSTDFYAILSTKGFQPAKTKGERCFKGIQLATSENK